MLFITNNLIFFIFQKKIGLYLFLLYFNYFDIII